MFLRSLRRLKVSPPAVRDVSSIGDLSYSPQYRDSRTRELSVRYNTVNKENRFECLTHIMEMLSGYKGRRQYKYRVDMKPLAERFKQMSMDWHDIKGLSTEEFLMVCDSLRMPSAQRIVLATAVHSKMCGVMTTGHDASPQTFCTRRGVPEHGWRCGCNGHEANIFFEFKATPPILGKHRTKEQGAVVETRPMPDFALEGRLNETYEPRTWSAPKDARFNIVSLGYDFRVHPQDPRYEVQITGQMLEWERHAEIVRLVLWEMLESFAVDKGVDQPLDMKRGELIRDLSQCLSNAYDPDGTMVEYRTIDHNGTVRPWMMTPPPQAFKDGIPTFLPFAPSLIIRSTITPGEIAPPESLAWRANVVCMSHHQAGFYWNPSNEAKVMQYTLDFARKMPYALPFFLYFRVDTMRAIKADDTFLARRQARFIKGN